ncbi:hypothetical protein [Paraburkholderia kirstenboschensis]|uniref:Uncharacterized protein n=1 Tax=Paraburkholderia kirstenboschensis TaxID=1245436 RepID=A0ABZ0EC70_9BURK|nr:hypothetical protein [Paraburkholderia kirstenboschensis]WOD14520.1 hypothetical protein RW095_03450 [Paraburkholderia kirstenboschensis]
MIDHPDRREEEERFMATFDSDFAVRHRDAFGQVAELTGHEPQGKLLGQFGDGEIFPEPQNGARVTASVRQPR